MDNKNKRSTPTTTTIHQKFTERRFCLFMILIVRLDGACVCAPWCFWNTKQKPPTTEQRSV